MNKKETKMYWLFFGICILIVLLGIILMITIYSKECNHYESLNNIEYGIKIDWNTGTLDAYINEITNGVKTISIKGDNR